MEAADSDALAADVRPLDVRPLKPSGLPSMYVVSVMAFASSGLSLFWKLFQR
jgi:hypothetical protein